MKKLTSIALAVSLATAAISAQASEAMSGPKVGFIAQGNIGEVVMNPYDIAPLTAVIRNGGYTLEDATVRIVPKKSNTTSPSANYSPTAVFRSSVSIQTTSTRWK